jgi:hypothetical protein
MLAAVEVVTGKFAAIPGVWAPHSARIGEARVALGKRFAVFGAVFAVTARIAIFAATGFSAAGSVHRVVAAVVIVDIV